MNSLVKSRDLQAVDVGYVADKRGEKLLPDNAAVDALAIEITELMQDAGFDAGYSSVSFGIQPWTGHTQNLDFRLIANNHVRCLIVISKTEFSAKFEEIEVAPDSDEFQTSDADAAIVRKTATVLGGFMTEKFPSRSTRISAFKNPASES